MSYSDAPIPTTAEAQFALWKSQVDETLARLVRSKSSKYAITVSGSTDAGGFITFNHDAQVVPQAIFYSVITPTPTDIWVSYTDNLTETTARARVLDTLGGNVQSFVGVVTFWAMVIV